MKNDEKTNRGGGITYKNPKGFTLIELLAVIVILAVIALILTPIVSGIIKTAKKNAFESTGYGILESTKLYYSKQVGELESDLTFTCNNDTCKSDDEKLEFKGTINGSGTVLLFKDGNIALCLESSDYATVKNINDERLSTTAKGTCEFDEETKEYSVNASIPAKEYEELQNQYNALNNTHLELLDNYNNLQNQYNTLNNTHLELLDNHSNLQNEYDNLNNTYSSLLDNYTSGKKLIAEAITSKGIATSEEISLDEMATNISKISQKSDRDFTCSIYIAGTYRVSDGDANPYVNWSGYITITRKSGNTSLLWQIPTYFGPVYFVSITQYYIASFTWNN